jgi:uncharacterized membrane protein
MLERRKAARITFLAVAALATAFVLTEIIMQSFGKSICFSEGCKMTAQYARFGDMSILLIGFAIFSSLMTLAYLDRKTERPGIERLINLILIVALTGEGFFMGYLAFRIHTVCIFCVIVFGFMVTLGVLRALSGEYDVLAGFATLAAVFVMHYVILPAGVTVDLPAKDRLLLFYSKDCRHCAEIIRELEEKKIPVAHLPVSQYGQYLKSVGIDSIPTLMVNDPNEKVFLTGESAIRRYLVACQDTKKPAVRTEQKAKARGKTTAPPQGTGTTIDIFNQQPSLLISPDQPSGDSGYCKEDQICK